jgi:hypothetical protein
VLALAHDKPWRAAVGIRHQTGICKRSTIMGEEDNSLRNGRDPMFKKLEATANISLIAVSVLFGFILLKSQVFPNRSSQPPELSPGTRLSLSGVDWKVRQRTLLLALSNQCHFCSESASFYKRLTVGVPKESVRVIAVLPQSVDIGREYLKSLDLHVEEIRQTPMEALNIRGTPTLILVNEDGVVGKVWRGKLSTEKEAEVMALLQTCGDC